MKILLVEDDSTLRSALEELLLREGYEVKKATNFREARVGLVSAIDLVMLDVGLPDGDGVSLCKLWRSEGVQTPILFLTAKDEELERTEAAFFFTVENDGGGVSPAELPKLFDRFYRAEGQKSSGVGIGLAIVREIVSRHHGTISAENGINGLCMTISMPMLDRNLTKS